LHKALLLPTSASQETNAATLKMLPPFTSFDSMALTLHCGNVEIQKKFRVSTADVDFEGYGGIGRGDRMEGKEPPSNTYAHGPLTISTHVLSLALSFHSISLISPVASFTPPYQLPIHSLPTCTLFLYLITPSLNPHSTSPYRS